MEPLTILLMVVLLLVMLAAGIHIGISLAVVGLLGTFLVIGEQGALAQLRGIPYNVTAVYTLAVVPMFILMGSLFTNAGFTARMYETANAWLSRFRGGLAAATVVGCAAFGAVTGSSVANAAVFSRIAIPEMVKHGVDKRLAVGAVAASGTLASLIPPSLLLVIFGIITEQSIGALLIAGILPGILSVFIYVVGIFVRVVRTPSLAPTTGEMLSLRERVRSLRSLWGAIVIFGTVMGGMYFGVFTPTQAGAVGAFAAFLLAMLRGGRLKGRATWNAVRDAGRTTGSILLILFGGAFVARFLGYSGAVRALSDLLLGLDMPSIFYLLVYAGLVLLLGMFLEAFAIMVLVLPLMFPILVDVGYHPIWIGIITIKLVEMGLITPPVGLNVYVVRSASPIPLSLNDVYMGVLPFLVKDAITVVILIAFPSITLVLPALML